MRKQNINTQKDPLPDEGDEYNHHKQIGDELKTSLSLLEAILESINHGILVISNHGTIIRTNTKFGEMWRIPAEILFSASDKTLLHFITAQLVDPDGFHTKVREPYESPEAESLDIIELTDNRFFKRISRPMYVGGKPTGRVWSFEDITARKHSEESMLNERLLLRTVIDNIPDSIYSKDLVSCKTLANLATLRNMRANSEAEVIGKDDFAFYPKEIAEEFFANDQYVIKTGIPLINKEEFIIDKNGEKQWQLTSKLPLRDYSGQIVGLVGIGHNITNRKLAEKALQESEALYRNLVEKLPDGVYKSTHDGEFVEVNPAMVKMMGYGSKEELMSVDIKTALYFEPEDRESLILQEKMEEMGVYRLRKMDGSEVWVEDHGWYNTDENGNILFHEGILRDITDRKRAEDLLRLSEERYRTIVNNTGEGIGFMNPDEQFEFANGAAEMIFGVGPGELAGMNLHQFINIDQFSLIKKETAKRAQGENSIYELDILRPNGEMRTLIITAVSQINHDGMFAGTYGVFRDITERKETEAEIKLKNEELLKLNTEKDKFFSIIAHDLRGPFSGFLGLTQIMAEELPGLTMDEIQKMAVSLRNSANNLFRLLENLLQWSQIQKGAIPFSPKEIRLHQVVEESIEMIQESAKAKKIEISFDIPIDTEIYADTNMLQTIIRNLVSNAVKFTRKEGKVSLSAKINNDKSLTLAICDKGIGMNSAMMHNLFRIDVATNRRGTDGEPSTGLGLLLCKEFVEKHGGKLWVESEEGNGSTFYFTIPYKKHT